MEYKQVCKTCGSEEVARCKWVNVNNEYIYGQDSGTTLEWCFGECRDETTIVDIEDYVKPDDDI
jgi:Flp pilus assembly secretin CpaC